MANTVKLRKGAKVGQAAAEDDEDFLRSCFFNNGSVDNLLDGQSRQCVLLGRTGSGKSALISEVLRRHPDNTITIIPEQLALTNISNSNVLRFFEAAGVHLDGFYVLLWKHIFALELIKKRYRIIDEAGKRRFFGLLADIQQRDRSKTIAVDYLNTWQDSFWLDTEHRISDLTKKVEGKLEGSAGLRHGPATLSASGARTLTEEERVNVVQHGQRAVSDIQIRELSKVMDLLAEDIFPPSGPQYYICIDGLDDDWVQDDIRFKLLKALLETIKSFRQVQSVKIIVTMRTDLLYSLYNSITSPGFQSEKFSGYYLPVKWTRAELAEMLNSRVNHLFQYQYSGQHVGLHDLMPLLIGPKTKSLDYILERTFFRPREAIAFLNRCIEKAEGASEIIPRTIKDAEYLYSEDRVVAVCDEWRREYPNLKKMCGILRLMSDGVEVAHYRTKKLEEFCLEFPRDTAGEEMPLSRLADDAACDAQQAGLPFLQLIFSILYRSGIVGLKLAPTTTRIYSFHDGVNVEPDHISLTTKVYVHKAFWITFGIRTSEFDTRQIQ